MAASGLPEAARADAASGIPATDAGGASCAAALNMALDAARRVYARSARFSTGNWNVEVVIDAVSAAKVPQPAAPQGARRHTQHGRANFRRGDTPNTPRDVDHDWRAAMNKPAGRCPSMGDAQKSTQAQQQERRQHGAARTARKQRRGPSYRRRSAGRAAKHQLTLQQPQQQQADCMEEEEEAAAAGTARPEEEAAEPAAVEEETAAEPAAAQRRVQWATELATTRDYIVGE